MKTKERENSVLKRVRKLLAARKVHRFCGCAQGAMIDGATVPGVGDVEIAQSGKKQHNNFITASQLMAGCGSSGARYRHDFSDGMRRGEGMGERNLPTTRKGIEEVFGGMPRSRVAQRFCDARNS